MVARKGFALRLTHDEPEGVWWAALSSKHGPERLPISRYGRGHTAAAAAIRARERFRQEQ